MRQFVPFKLTIEKRPGYLYARYEADPVTLSDVIATVNGVAQAIYESGYDRVLLVRNSPLLESEDNRELLNAMLKKHVPKGVKVALVDIFGNDPEAVARAAEASKTVGWDLTIFPTVAEAEQWLATL